MQTICLLCERKYLISWLINLFLIYSNHHILFPYFLNFYFSSTTLFLNPVPAGINRPIMTFSLSPRRESTPPLMAFSMSTRLVFWNDAAESQLLVRSDTSVIPSTTVSAL